MSARQPSQGQFHLGRLIPSLLIFGLLALGGCVQHQPFQEQPFLRIETGMHTALSGV
jgi:hypothetical protein